MKRFCAAFLLCLTLALPAFAQQLTRFAVVDLSRIYTAFFSQSKAVRDFEEKSTQVQATIDRLSAELETLKSQKVDAELAGDQTRALRLESEISKKSDFLREYFAVKTEELENQKKKLAQNQSFFDQVSNQIRIVAESEGYTMALSLNNNPSIVWYSPSVDITDKVIQNLLSSTGGR